MNARPNIKFAPEPVSIQVNETTGVSGLMQRPWGARACLVLAHGAGAGLKHPFVGQIAHDLAARGIATLRYQFPYVERGGRRPDSPGLCHATVRAAVVTAGNLAAKACARGGRKILRGSNDLSSTSSLAPAWRSWFGILWLSAACAESTVRGTRRASAAGQDSDVVSARYARCDGRSDTNAASDQTIGEVRDVEGAVRRRPFISRPGAKRAHRCASAQRAAGFIDRLDSLGEMNLGNWSNQDACRLHGGYEAGLRELAEMVSMGFLRNGPTGLLLDVVPL